MRFFFSYLQRFINWQHSPKKLALSFCIGNYIAFSPFLGLHTIMVFILSWLLNLNTPLVFAVSCGVNNPWTAAPIYSLDYLFGYWLIHHVLHYDSLYIPSWYGFIVDFFQHKLGMAAPCIWSFLIGGNLLAILVSVLIYPMVLFIFSRMCVTRHQEA